MGILAAMTFVRFGLEPLVKMLRKVFVAPGTWEKSSEYYILKEVLLSESESDPEFDIAWADGLNRLHSHCFVLWCEPHWLQYCPKLSPCR